MPYDSECGGNQVIGNGSTATGFAGTGIFALATAEDIVIEANQVIAWGDGIRVDGSGKIVRKNQVSLNAVHTRLYDRSDDPVTLDEIERVNYRSS